MRGLLLIMLFLAVGAHGSEQPNILLLVAEDLSFRIGAFGDEVAQTPNIDELAESGTRYSNVFTTAGVCAPSRASLITGQYQISFGAQHMRSSTGPLGEYYAQPDPAVRAFPELLRRAGYYTFTDGKLDYQFSGVRAGSGPFTIWDAENLAAPNAGPDVADAWRARADGQPFFGMINFMETHESGVMDTKGSPHSQSHAGSVQMRKQLGIVAPAVTEPLDVVVPPIYPDIPAVRADLARHYDNVVQMDARVGEILNALEADGLLESTVIIWTTDHGDGLPRAKRELFDTGIKVPMIIRFPDATGAGTLDERLISFVDLAPTILDIAGVEVATYHHGVNFFEEERDYIFASRDRIDEVPDRQRAVSDGRYKYIRSWYPETPGGHELAYRDNLAMVRAMRDLFNAGKLSDGAARWFQPPGTEQLYDTETDPYELNNLAASEEYANIRQRLAAAMTDWQRRVGDLSDMAEEQMRAGFLDEGEVPVTPAPTTSVTGDRLSFASEYSIGYRVNGGRWQLYVSPLSVTPDTVYEARAVRYGWQASAVVRYSTESN